MNSKLKKWILSVAIVMIVLIGALIGVTFLSRLSTSTIHDLRFFEVVDQEETATEIFEKTVYLQAEEDNHFQVELKNNASVAVDFKVYSTNQNVATVASDGDGLYTITYLASGQTNIVATTASKSNVSEQFTLHVKNSLPTRLFVSDPENANIVGESEVNIFADTLKYAFNLVAMKGDIDENFNYGSISIVDNYNHDLLKTVKIDASKKQLVLVSNQSSKPSSEIITLQVHDEDGLLLTSQNIIVNVKGYYISDMQLVLSQTPDFVNAVNVFGSGLIAEGEHRVDKVVFTEDVNTIYAKVRVIYTNGEIRDVSAESVSEPHNVSSIKNDERFNERYFTFRVTTNENPYVEITLPKSQVFETEIVTKFEFSYYLKNSTEYNNFMNKELYRFVEDPDNFDYYEYIYWDTRFQRDDVITRDGKIVDFVSNPPSGKSV